MFYFSSHFWGFKKGNTSLKCNSNQFNIIFFIGKPFFVTQIFQIKKEQFFKFFTGIYNERFWHLIPIRKFLEHLTQFFNIVSQDFSFVCIANPLSILFSKLKLSSWKECFKKHIWRLFFMHLLNIVCIFDKVEICRIYTITFWIISTVYVYCHLLIHVLFFHTSV